MAKRIPVNTLQLARAIATAVLAAGSHRHRNSTQDAPTQAVLRTLERTGTWFMAVDTDHDGAIIGGSERRMPSGLTPAQSAGFAGSPGD